MIVYDASGVLFFFLADVMRQYCNVCDSNRLVRAVEADLEVRAYIIGCRALGMIGKLITTRQQREVVRPDGSEYCRSSKQMEDADSVRSTDRRPQPDWAKQTDANSPARKGNRHAGI